jgi:hypothetical protein
MKWRYGCDAEMTVYVPRGGDYRELTVRCGSTAHDGGVNQCAACERRHPMPPAHEDESDMDYFERTDGADRDE